jgi:hypothetical protein
MNDFEPQGPRRSAAATVFRVDNPSLHTTVLTLTTLALAVRCSESITTGIQLRLSATGIPSLKKGPESLAISVADASMSVGHASNGPRADFDTDLSRTVNLLRLITLTT